MYNPTQELKNLINQKSFSYLNANTLLAQGASPNVKNEDGISLLELFLKTGQDWLVKNLVINHQADVALAFNIPLTYQIQTLEYNQGPSNQVNPILLGEGAYGKTYTAKHNNSEVALKTLKSTNDDGEISFCKLLNDFIQEVRCMMTLTEIKSENIIQFIGIYKNQPNLFANTFPYSIVMEKATLGTLEDIIEKKPQLLADKKTRKHIVLSLVKGMQAIHQHFIYCDFKDANILLSQGTPLGVKIIDFGLSCKLDEKNSRGAPITRAPEIFNNGENSILSDIYSLGLVIRETMILKTVLDCIPVYVTTPFELFEHITRGNSVYIPDTMCTFKIEMLIYSCLNFYSHNRPTTDLLIKRLGLKSAEVYALLKPNLPTPLTLACKYGRTELVRALISNKNINEVSKEGCTPLIAACSSSRTHNNPELFKLLVQHNVDYHKTNLVGQTALDLAFLNKNETAIRILMHDIQYSIVRRESIMSSDTVVLAKAWALQNVLQDFFTDAFFKPILESNEQQKLSSEQSIEDVTHESYLTMSINKIGFFHSTPNTLNNKEVNFLVKSVFAGKISLERIPEAYGLRTKTLTLFKNNMIMKIKNVWTLAELNETITQLNKVSPHLEPNPQETITNIDNFFKNLGELDKIPEHFGIRDKAQELKQSYASNLYIKF